MLDEDHINKFKIKTVSQEMQKSFGKIQHPFMILKTLQQVVIEKTYLNIIKTMYGKPIASHTSLYSVMKTESISSKFRNKTRMPSCHFYSAEYWMS